MIGIRVVGHSFSTSSLLCCLATSHVNLVYPSCFLYMPPFQYLLHQFSIHPLAKALMVSSPFLCLCHPCPYSCSLHFWPAHPSCPCSVEAPSLGPRSRCVSSLNPTLPATLALCIPSSPWTLTLNHPVSSSNEQKLGLRSHRVRSKERPYVDRAGVLAAVASRIQTPRRAARRDLIPLTHPGELHIQVQR